MKNGFFLIALLLVRASFAANPELVARAGLNDGFNLPPMSFIDNTSPAINDHGLVAFKVLSIAGTARSAVWLGNAQGSKIVHTVQEDRYISDISLNNYDHLAFQEFDENGTYGVLLINDQGTRTVIGPDKWSMLSSPTLNDQGLVLVQSLSKDGRRGLLFSDLREESGPAHGASYFFRPSPNRRGSWAVKARLGAPNEWDESRPDEIWTWDVQGQKKVLAKDRDALPTSPYRSFHNGVSLSDDEQAVFVAELVEGGRALIAAGPESDQVLLREGEAGVRQIEYFTPKVNGRGEIALRAIDLEGKRAIFFSESGKWRRLIGEGDPVVTDLGPARITLKENFPGLSGDISMNSKGQVAFHALLTSEDGAQNFGAGIFVMDAH